MKSPAALIATLALVTPVWSAAKTEVTLPRGTSIELRMVTPFDSDRVEKGKIFQAAVLRSVYADGRLVIPKDSVVMGMVRHVRGTRDKARSAAIAVRFGTVEFPGEAYAIDGALTSFDGNDRRKILEEESKLAAGRKVDVVLVAADGKVGPRVGSSAPLREDVADEWAASGLGAPVVTITRGTVVAMRLEKPVTLPARPGTPEEGDRRILIGADAVRRAQQALKTRGLYAGEASGVLDEATRRAIAAFQIDRGHPATGDLDDVTAGDLSR